MDLYHLLAPEQPRTQRLVDGFKADLEALGMQVIDTSPADNLVSGYLPVGEILALPGVPHFAAA